LIVSYNLFFGGINMAEMMVVKSKVAEYVKGKDMMFAGDSAEALSGIVQQKLDRAIQRCKENGRKTVKPYDF
jgi:histone H3/H4